MKDVLESPGGLIRNPGGCYGKKEEEKEVKYAESS